MAKLDHILHVIDRGQKTTSSLGIRDSHSDHHVWAVTADSVKQTFTSDMTSLPFAPEQDKQTNKLHETKLYTEAFSIIWRWTLTIVIPPTVYTITGHFLPFLPTALTFRLQRLCRSLCMNLANSGRSVRFQALQNQPQHYYVSSSEHFNSLWPPPALQHDGTLSKNSQLFFLLSF